MPEDIEPRTTPAQASDALPASHEGASGAPTPDELTDARRERDDYYDRLLRQAAEFDNYRKRTERERREMVQYAAGDVLEALRSSGWPIQIDRQPGSDFFLPPRPS